MEYIQKGRDVVVQGLQDFNLDEILDCGQCFRFARDEDGLYHGVACGQALHLHQQGSTLTVRNITLERFKAKVLPYFDLTRDYSAIKATMAQNTVLAKAAAFAPGMRVLNQDSWEALCSFIISQNNNISRIKGIIQRLCTTFGADLGEGAYAFPTPQALAGRSVEDLAPLRAGFRAKYILDAAQKVASGQIDLAATAQQDLPTAQATLCQILGVGPKVAHCALLFGFGMAQCFPEDVWIKRAMAQLLPKGLPTSLLPVAGLVQQYLFHYVRLCPGALTENNSKSSGIL